MSSMRPARAIVTALLVAAVALPGCGARDNNLSEPPAAPPSAAPATPPMTSTQPPLASPPSSTKAVATAVSFMRREVGMADPVAGRFRWTGTNSGQVEVRARIPDDVNPLRGPVSTVSLQRLTSVWYVLGVRSDAIGVVAPRPQDPVRSPVQVMASLAGAVEGRAHVRITQDRYGKDPELGSGYLSRTSPSPNVVAAVAFRRPSSPTGSVVLTTSSGRNGEIWASTVVRVRFATVQPPQILDVRTSPPLVKKDGWSQLPALVTFQVTATGAQRARLVFTGTGTESAWGAHVVAQDSTAGDGLRLTWRPRGLSGHLWIEVLGPGGIATHQLGEVMTV
jgi:hypothetical protein